MCSCKEVSGYITSIYGQKQKLFVLWLLVLILKFKKKTKEKKKSILTRNELIKEEGQSRSLYGGASRLLHSKFYINF